MSLRYAAEILEPGFFTEEERAKIDYWYKYYRKKYDPVGHKLAQEGRLFTLRSAYSREEDYWYRKKLSDMERSAGWK